MNDVFYLLCAEMLQHVTTGVRVQRERESCKGICEENEVSAETEESPLLEAVTRERLCCGDL
jgi:hypothetical protein